jgi:hypothetical protein
MTTDALNLVYGLIWLGISIIVGAEFSRDKTIQNCLSFIADFSVSSLFFELYFYVPNGFLLTSGVVAGICIIINLFLYVRKKFIENCINSESYREIPLPQP